MVQCKAWGCATQCGEGIAMHSFPKDLKLKKQWVVKVNRQDFTMKEACANNSSKLCGLHFRDSDYVTSPKLLTQFGMKMQPKLRAGVVPSVFPHKQVATKVRRSEAFMKRRNIEILEESMTVSEVNSSSSDEDPSPLNVDSEATCSSTSQPCQEEKKETGIAVQTDHITMRHQAVSVSIKPSTKERGNQSVAKGMDKASQTYLQTKDAGIQCMLIEPNGIDEEDIEEDMDTDAERSDPDWLPGEEDVTMDDIDFLSDDLETEICESLEENPSPARERKFLVYESCLRALLAVCTICSSPCAVMLESCKGSMITLKATCHNAHSRVWSSQPLLGSLPRGNLDIAAGILFSGSTAAKALNIFRNINIFTITTRTFIRLQKYYLIPSVFRIWKHKQDNIYRDMRKTKEKSILGGDARCDSIREAKYGSYSLMNLVNGLIICLVLVQRNEVSSSSAMELEGLKRGLQEMKKRRVPIGTIITDRHVGVKSYLKKMCQSIIHLFDVWHVAKSIYKKLQKASKRRTCQIIQEWAKGIQNHLYWSVTSSKGDGELAKAKWLSILNHVADVHTEHGHLYPQCEHGELEPRKWIKKGSKAHKELELVVGSRRLVNDIGQLSPYEQTSSVESFHKIVCYFAPKSLHFFYNAMKARLLLAVLHFNENKLRQQKMSKDGQLQYTVSFQRFAKDRGFVKEVKVPPTYNYIQELLHEVYSLRKMYPSYREADVIVQEYCKGNPDNLTSDKVSINKEDLISSHVSRFGKRC